MGYSTLLIEDSPASLKLTVSTPFSIRHIQWPSTKSDKTNSLNDGNQLAVHCDRCVRIYDMRRTGFAYLMLQSTYMHTQRVISIDWTYGKSFDCHRFPVDQTRCKILFYRWSLLLAESIPNEQSTFCISAK